jgi:hypothetical protein
MTIGEIAALMRPAYENARTRTEKLMVIRRWDHLLEAAEPDPPKPDGLQAAIDSTMSSWSRHVRRQQGRAQ